MILVFSAALSLAGLHLNRFFAETMRLRFELGAANLRLQAEIKPPIRPRQQSRKVATSRMSEERNRRQKRSVADSETISMWSE
jgi:hypothetical protein